MAQQPADVDGVPLELRPDPVVEPVKPGLPTELDVVPV
jgi:hypothetical protein